MSAKNETRGAYWLVALLLVPIAIMTFTALNSRTPRIVVISYTSGVCVSSAVAISDLAGLTNISASLGLVAAGGRQFGLTNHPNTLGLTCAITIPFAVYFLHTAPRKWLARVAIVVLLGGALASGSRGAQVAAPLAAVATVMFLPNRRISMRQLGIIVGAGLLAGIAIGSVVAPDRLTELVRFGSGDIQGAGKSDAVRSIVLNQAIDDFLRFPLFGLGLRHLVEAHNIYVQLLASGGLILLLSMLCYWGGAVSDARSLYKSGESIALPLMVSISTWLVLGVVENQITDRYLYYGIGCVAALVGVRARKPTPHLPRRGPTAAWIP
jgi:O-antigen ligase